MLGIFHQRKIVARRADLKRVADFQLVENVTRATAACGIELDGDDVAVRIGARIEQRELPDQSVRQMNVDVRAGLVGRKLAAVGPPERVNIRVARGVLNIAQHHVDQRVASVLGGGRGSGQRCGHRVHAGIDMRVRAGSATCCFAGSELVVGVSDLEAFLSRFYSSIRPISG